ncbi:MAG TPA: bifunctional YncE family protein/alkaline phosphatase family protein, partial [Puia sp.]
QAIQLFDTKSGRQLDSVEINVSWGGIAFTSDEKFLYVSGGNDNIIIKYAVGTGKLINSDTIKLGPKFGKISPTGISIDDKKQLLYVTTKENNSLYVINMKDKSVVRQLPLTSEGYTCLLSPDQKELYVSSWGDQKVMVYNTESGAFTDSVMVGNHPNDLCVSKNGQYLFVANAMDNSVSVVDIRKRKVLETLNAALYPESRVGSTTNGVALSTDEKTLFVADADNNCVAVFDVHQPGSSVSRGFIPTGWYPTCVRTIGKQIYVANGKGFSSFPNPNGPNPIDIRQRVFLHQGDSVRTRNPKVREQYIGGGLLMGSLSMIPVPTDEQLAVFTQAVYKNCPYKKESELTVSGIEGGNPIPSKVGAESPIKHVFYIIKENRTYDQVLGDLTGGNGDTSLVLFGRRITPNQHALADEFVLLDNFYVDGEVSADGHQWSMGAYATDYMEKIWPSAYGHRGGNYATPTVLDKAYIWDQCAKAGVSYRTYGEFINNNKPAIPSLEGHFCPYFLNMDQRIFDTARAYKWMQEFDSLVAVNAVPAFQTVRFGNDHTEGTSAGRPTPFAHVADNDLAVGLFVEHLSKSPIWKESVVFILEDDAQNGPDHVDAHRSPAYVAGGFVKRHFVDHTMYTTSSMLHTMELILGLQPMTQYDAAAVPMWRSFAAEANTTPFKALPESINLLDVNPAKGKL